MSRDNPEQNLKRFPTMLRPEQLDEVDRYRQDVGTLPSAAKAIRDMIDLGLKTYWESKEKGRV